MFSLAQGAYDKEQIQLFSNYSSAEQQSNAYQGVRWDSSFCWDVHQRVPWFREEPGPDSSPLHQALTGSTWMRFFQVLALHGSAETCWEHKELLLLSARRTPDITDVAAAGNVGSPENGSPSRNQQLRSAYFQETGVHWEVLVAG